MSPPRLIYEDGCALCAASAKWIARNARETIEIVPFDDPRLPPALSTDRSRVHWIEDGRVLHGGAAVTRALRRSRFGPAARLLDLPLLASLRDLAYRVIGGFHRPRRGRR